jgi:hypothetical protein
MLLLIRKKTADRHERNLNHDRPAPQAKTDFSMSRGKKRLLSVGGSRPGWARGTRRAALKKVFFTLSV